MITIRRSVGNDIKNNIPVLLEQAITWMQKKYPDIDFNKPDYIFSAGYNRSRYFRNEVANAKYINPNVCICTRAKLMLYNKPSLGIKTRTLFVGSIVQILCSLIHELTHHVQYETNIRKGNELDTTANELEFLKENYPTFYNKIVK